MKSKDWREQGQEKYLSHVEFWKTKYVSYKDILEHDHCEFCWQKFCELTLDKDCHKIGYATKDKKRWICEECFVDFKETYNLINLSLSNKEGV